MQLGAGGRQHGQSVRPGRADGGMVVERPAVGWVTMPPASWTMSAAAATS